MKVMHLICIIFATAVPRKSGQHNHFSERTTMIELRTVNLTRYITPLREGGSLPALAEADDEFKYVVKFRGAGHGTKALISELIGGEVARVLGFRVPELVFLNLDEAFGRTEGDEEIQDLLQGSRDLRPRGNPSRPRPGFPYRLAGCLPHEHRPHFPQHQYADVAQGTLADRPGRFALLPSLVGELGEACGKPLCLYQESCIAARSIPARRSRCRPTRPAD